MDAALGDGTIQKTYGQANRQHKYLSHGSDRRPFAASIENYPVSVRFDRRGMRRWVTAPSNSSSSGLGDVHVHGAERAALRRATGGLMTSPLGSEFI